MVNYDANRRKEKKEQDKKRRVAVILGIVRSIVCPGGLPPSPSPSPSPSPATPHTPLAPAPVEEVEDLPPRLMKDLAASPLMPLLMSYLRGTEISITKDVATHTYVSSSASAVVGQSVYEAPLTKH